MSTAITAYVNATLDEKRQYAQTIASAGDLLPKTLWANVKNPDTGLMENRPSPGKVMMIVETGIMLGIHPMAALQGIDVIEGHATIKPSLMSALIRQAGHKFRVEQTGTVEGGDIRVTATGIRSDDPDHPYVYTWTPQDALRAGLLDSYAPDATGKWVGKARSKDNNPKPWESYMPRLLRWRAISDTASAGFEDVLMGMHYSAEELGAVVNEREEVVAVDAEIVPTKDWEQLIDEATTKDELLAIAKEADGLGEYPDALRTIVLTKIGKLSREVKFEEEAETPAPEPVDEGDVTPHVEEIKNNQTMIRAHRTEVAIAESDAAERATRDPAAPSEAEYEQMRLDAEANAAVTE